MNVDTSIQCINQGLGILTYMHTYMYAQLIPRPTFFVGERHLVYLYVNIRTYINADTYTYEDLVNIRTYINADTYTYEDLI